MAAGAFVVFPNWHRLFGRYFILGGIIIISVGGAAESKWGKLRIPSGAQNGGTD